MSRDQTGVNHCVRHVCSGPLNQHSNVAPRRVVLTAAVGPAVLQVFTKVDYNRNGLIEPLEVEVAVLNLYNIVNKRLPGWQDPPSRDEIQVKYTHSKALQRESVWHGKH